LHGWLMASLGFAAGSEAVDIFRTADGGATWNRVYRAQSGIAELPKGALGFSCDKTEISFRDVQVGWISADCSGSGVLYETTDAGLTWRSEPLPGSHLLPNVGASGLDTIRLGAPQFFGGHAGILAGDELTPGPGQDPQRLHLFSSSDGGARWTALTPIGAADTLASFSSPSDGWVAGLDPKWLEHTIDGGRSWNRLVVGVDGPGWLGPREINYVGPLHGYALATTTTHGTNIQPWLYETRNGGRLWNRVQFAIG